MTNPADLTGPPYPPPPGAGSNRIGQFIIGTSTIGDIPPFNIWKTIISQYANSSALVSLITSFVAAIDQTENLQEFFDNIWNVDTAQGLGLEIWGRIVGVSRVLQVIGPVDYFGFEEATDAQGFNVASFYSGQPLTFNYALADQTFRQLILAKAWANISDNSIPNINKLLMTLFPHRGNAYVTEGAPETAYFNFEETGPDDGTPFGADCEPFYGGQADTTRMTMTYTFLFQLSDVDLAIVQNSGVLPKPTGVKASIVQIF